MKDVHLVDAARTPIGRCDGAPAGVRPDASGTPGDPRGGGPSVTGRVHAAEPHVGTARAPSGALP